MESAETPVRHCFVEPLAAGQLELLRKLENVKLSRTRILRELETSESARYRIVLNKALTDLNAELARLERGTVRVATA
jgi:hypothetical protein